MTELKLVSRRTVLSGALGVAAASALSGRALAAFNPGGSKDFTVLTVAGAIDAPNRGPLVPAKEKLFRNHNIAFSQAFAFGRDILLGTLPQKTVSAKSPDGVVTYEGPGLIDVLRVAGVKGQAKTVKLMGLDGYSADLPLADIAEQGWILAMSADGAPFGLGDLGPCYSVRELGGDVDKTENEDAKWVHSIFYIEVKA